MTGFGAAEAEAKGVSVRAEIRSVNHRHLQAKLRLPPEAGHLEPEVEGLIRKKLSRGALTVNVHVARHGPAAAARLDEDLARAYCEQLTAMGRRLGIEAEVELEDLLGLPGVVAGGDDDLRDSHVGRLVLRAVSAAARELLEMRAQEGEALERDLQKHAQAIGRAVAKIGRRMPKVVRVHQANLKLRVQELIGDSTALDAADLAREVALLADRLDVSEELTRLEAHLEQLVALLAKGGSVGRKLDFLAQEFLREANTIGSKCNDAQVAHDVVDLKTHIERLREQVQNVE